MRRFRAAAQNWLGLSQGRIMTGLVLVIGLYFVLSFGEQAWQARELESEVVSRQSELAELEAHRDDLRNSVSDYGSERYHLYVEQTARRELNLSYPGETVLLIRWAAAAPESPAHGSSDHEAHERQSSTWEKWLAFLRQD